MGFISRTFIFFAVLSGFNVGLSNAGDCTTWQVECANGECVSYFVYYTCNGVKDCQDGSDEAESLCGTTTSTTTEPSTEKPSVKSSIFEEKVLVPPSTKDSLSWSSEEEDTNKGNNIRRGDISAEIIVDPPFQQVWEDETVRVSCRDESASRYKVRWSRLSDKPWPKNAYDNNDGLLEIRNVNIDNSGYYCCIAVDVPNGEKYENVTFILVEAVKKPLGSNVANKNKTIRAVSNYNINELNQLQKIWNNYRIQKHSTTRIPYTRPTVTNYPLQFSYYPKATKAPEPRPTQLPEGAQQVPCNYTVKPGQCCYTILHCVDCETTTTTPSPTPTAGPILFRCANGAFIDIKLKCNRINDCSDGSDEYGCPPITTTTTVAPGCTLDEFECHNGQCIENNKYCDGEMDCDDGSDEPSTCKVNSRPRIIQLPRLRTELNCVDPSEPSSVPRNALELECKFVGEPTPRVYWKKYESFVPSKCQISSRNGHGILFCPDFEPSDQGAYSCVGENAVGAAESQPKSIAVCNNPIACSNGFKVIDEQNIENCFECYCSNKTKECHNIQSTKKTEILSFPENKVEIFVSKNGTVTFIPTDGEPFPPTEVRSSSEAVTYCTIHDSVLNKYSFVKSYGRNIKIPRTSGFPNFAIDAPDLIIRGHGLALTYSYKKNLGNSATVDIRFWRGHFHHIDNSVATRFDLMRVLANIDALLIRCEYKQGITDEWDDSDEIELESAVIEGNSDSASFLERCICPTGYSGLSCEACAPDYEREEGTDNCVKKITPPPSCNEGYTGKDCDECDNENGYYYSPSKKTCSKISCNILGRMGTNLDPSGKCICKEHVMGEECDTCKPGSFNLNAKDYTGCTKCWCNGVSDECQSSNWRRSFISSISSGGYNSSDGRNFWLLPEEFNGNKLTSYGGRLDYTIKYAPGIQKQQEILTVEFLSQDNNTIIYYHPDVDRSTDKDVKSWSVKIEEPFWRNRDNVILSRFEILKALVNIKAIYIESPYHLSSGFANLSSVRLDIAEEDEDEDGIVAVDVEQCKCPEGYTGLSCESCSRGYTRDKINRSSKCVKCNCTNCDPEEGCQDCPDHFYDFNYNNKSLSRDCRQCPCNNNEKSCWKDDWDEIICSCKAGYSGRNCEKKELELKSQLKVIISPNKVKNKKVGTTIMFNCSYESTEKMIIRFKKVYGKKSGDMDAGIESGFEEQQSTNQFGSMRSLEVVLDDGLTHVECFVFNLLDMEVGRVMAVIDIIENIQEPKITNCYVGHHRVKEEGNLDLSCEAKGSPTPEIIWYKNDVRIASVDGVHSIKNASLSDSGIYRCEAMNGGGSDQCNHKVEVEKKCLTLEIIPERIRTEEGEDINLLCKASEDGRISWKRLEKDLPIFDFRYSTHNNGILSIKNAEIEDSGEFVCIFTSKETTMNKSATVVVERRRTKPTASILEGDSTINTGEYFEINCEVTGYPQPTVSWKWEKKSLDNIEIANTDTKLIIRGAKLENQGIYTCFAISSEGNSSESIYITVRDSLRAPKISIRPNSVITVERGNNIDVECVILEGTPVPTIRWARLDGTPIYSSSNILSFSKVSISDSGRYLCIAENRAGRAEASLEIDVLYPPTVKVFPSEIREVVGTEVKIQCEVSGNPLPVPTWREEKTQRHLKRTTKDFSRNQTDMQIPRRRLGLVVQILDESYQYTCIAENILGKAQASIPVHILPENVQTTGVLEIAELGTSFTIKCEGVAGKVEWSKLNGKLQGDECEQTDGLKIPSVQVQHRGTYICKSVDDPSIKKYITLHVKGFVNKFSNERNSFMVLPMKVKPDGFHVEITFKPDNLNGLLLLEKENQKFLVYLKDGRVHARINFDPPLDIVYNVRLNLGKWYSAILNVQSDVVDLLVYGEDGKDLNGLIKVIDQDVKKIDWSVIKDVYVGGTNKTTKDFKTMNNFHSVPFEGCVSRLIVDDHEYNITQEGLYSKEVKLCKICKEKDPCKGEGVCLDAPSHFGFVCVCPNGNVQKETTTCPRSCEGLGCDTKVNFCELLDPCNDKGSNIHSCIAFGSRSSSFHCHCAVGYSGTTCENVKEFSFHLNGNGFANISSNNLVVEEFKPERIEIEFTPDKLDGLLLWQGDDSNHLYIGLHNGHIEYVYHNQKIPLKVTSGKIQEKKTHTLTAIRANNTVTLIVDGNENSASAGFKTNRVKGNVFVGGLPNIEDILNGRFSKGLVGCINYVNFGNEKEKINILEPGVELHNANKKCISQNEIDNETHEFGGDEFSDDSESIENNISIDLA